MTNPVNYNKEDVYALANYNYGVSVPAGYSASDALIGTGIVAGGYSLWKGGKWAWNNRHDYKGGWQNVKNGFNNAKQLKGANLKETYLNNYRSLYIEELEKRYKVPKVLSDAEKAKLSPSKLASYNRKQAISAEYDKVRQLIKESKTLKGEELLKKQTEIKQALADAKLSVAKGKAAQGSTMAPTTKAGKAGQWLKGKTGITKAEVALKTSAANGSKAARFLTKAPKGTPATTVIALALEAPEVYKTYKELGAVKGTKQLGKSVAIAGAGVAGYALGSMALGAAVGSVVPIAGTAVGAVVGLIGGLLGAWGADTLARKLLPSERELAAKQKADEAMQDPEKMKQLLADTQEAVVNETDTEKINQLKEAYNNTYTTLAPAVAPAEEDKETKSEQTENKTGSTDNTKKQTGTDKIRTVLETILKQLKTGWNFYNPDDVYNSLRQYEKPVYPSYQQFMGYPYGMVA